MYNVKAVFNFATLLNGCTMYMHAYIYVVEIIGFKVKCIGYVYSVYECVGVHVYILWCILGRHIRKAKPILHNIDRTPL